MKSLQVHLLPLLTAVTLLAGCVAQPQTDALVAAAGGLPNRAAVTGVMFQPHVDQEGAPGALAMALQWSGRKVDPVSLVPALLKDGRQDSILATATRHGRIAYPIHDMRSMLAELAAGNPVLALQEPSNGPVPVWRYALVVGYDLERQILELHSGVIRNLKLSMPVFEENWGRAGNWAVVILPPERMPATASEADYLKAAQSLVDKETAWEAVVAHDSALVAWPRSASALLGLGRSLRALGDENGADSAFRMAAQMVSEPQLGGRALTLKAAY